MKVFEAIRILDRKGRFAPKVLDADGVEVEVGDDLYSVEGMLKFHVSAIDKKNGRIATEAMLALDKWADPKMYTHRAPVLDADGAEIRVGDTVYDVEDGCELVVTKVTSDAVFVAFEDVEADKYDASQLTHRAPVLASDGRPLREGEHVYHVETGTELVVKELPKPGEYQAVVVFALPTSPASHLTSFDPDRLTHERPDSWERLEEDAKKDTCAYFGVDGGGYGCSECPVKQWKESCDEVKSSDLVRRCRALAERERGE